MTSGRNDTQVSISELAHASACFEGYFLQAVALRLTGSAREMVVRVVERDRNGEHVSPILEAIRADAIRTRRAVLARAFEGDDRSYVDSAVERAAARVMRLFERDNVVPLAPRREKGLGRGESE
jgi:hypothetical protein